MKHMIALLLLLMTITAQSGQDTFVTVGPDNDCDFNTLETAYDNGANEIRVTNQVVYTEVFNIARSVNFAGGYADCESANDNIFDTGNNGGVISSRWSGEEKRTVVSITADENIEVFINNFFITDGFNQSFNAAGGIKVNAQESAHALLTLDNVFLSNNVGESGGAIQMNRFSTLILTNSVLHQNRANFGAGVYYSGGRNERSHVIINSSINDNIAEISGGGVYLNDASLQLAPTDTLRRSIWANTANVGGGIYAHQSSIATYTGDLIDDLPASASVAFYINKAVSIIDQTEAQGAGIYLDSSELDLKNALFLGNASEYQGGGLYMDGLSSMVLENANFVENQASNDSEIATSGGAMYIAGSSTVQIEESEFYENYAQSGSFMTKSGDGVVNIDNSEVAFHVTFPNQSLSSSLIKLDEHVANASNQLNIIHCTFAYNTTRYLIESADKNGDFRTLFENSIVANGTHDQIYLTNNLDERLIFNYSGLDDADSLLIYIASGNVELNHALLTDDFLFTDPLSGDFTLQSRSPAIDYAPYPEFYPVFDQYVDFRGIPRGLDEPSIENQHGSYDIGAHEYIDDLIFASAFE